MSIDFKRIVRRYKSHQGSMIHTHWFLGDGKTKTFELATRAIDIIYIYKCASNLMSGVPDSIYECNDSLDETGFYITIDPIVPEGVLIQIDYWSE